MLSVIQSIFIARQQNEFICKDVVALAQGDWTARLRERDSTKSSYGIHGMTWHEKRHKEHKRHPGVTWQHKEKLMASRSMEKWTKSSQGIRGYVAAQKAVMASRDYVALKRAQIVASRGYVA